MTLSPLYLIRHNVRRYPTKQQPEELYYLKKSAEKRNLQSNGIPTTAPWPLTIVSSSTNWVLQLCLRVLVKTTMTTSTEAATFLGLDLSTQQVILWFSVFYMVNIMTGNCDNVWRNIIKGNERAHAFVGGVDPFPWSCRYPPVSWFISPGAFVRFGE